jgi:DNA-binding protein
LQDAKPRGIQAGCIAVSGTMVPIEHLGDDLGEDYVVIAISRDMRLADEIKKRAEANNRVKIKAWGKTISIAVRLALAAIAVDLPVFKIGAITIGTEEGVEIPAKPRSRFQDAPDADPDAGAGEQGNAGEKRVTKAMSWVETAIEKV